jgi:hypothetical protein
MTTCNDLMFTTTIDPSPKRRPRIDGTHTRSTTADAFARWKAWTECEASRKRSPHVRIVEIAERRGHRLSARQVRRVNMFCARHASPGMSLRASIRLICIGIKRILKQPTYFNQL